jgi:Type I restriction-modification system methyltransferase subunit
LIGGIGVFVYIRCESEELERIEYKPDYPFSRLHITLYEGNDIAYAKKLYSLLAKRGWHFKLSFEESRRLTEKTIGSKTPNDLFLQNIELLFKEILGKSVSEFLKNNIDNDSKLGLIKKILDQLYKYLSVHSIDKKIESYYKDQESINNLPSYIDESKNSTYVENYLSVNPLFFDNTPVEKPVPDAIFVTPPEYARDMAKCALDAFGNDSRKIDFGDSAVGTGALFLALKNLLYETNEAKNTKYEISSAIGIDIDEKMAKEASFRYGKRGLAIIYGDSISPDINLGSQRNLMLVNPPYNRQEHIPKKYRLQARQLAKEQTGINIMGDAGLYVYHLLIMDKWLSKDGVAVWLLPSFFLQSKYGEAVRQYLLNKVQLIRLHIYNDKKLQFENFYISTTIVIFKKEIPEESVGIIVSYGESMVKPSFNAMVDRKSFLETSGNWRKIVNRTNENQDLNNCDSKQIKFEDLFDIKRGLATGANSFFVMKRIEAEKRGIPDFALKPLLPKARYLNSLIINSQDDGYPDVEPQLVLIDCNLDEEIIRKKYPDFFNYLQVAKEKGKDGKSILNGP